MNCIIVSSKVYPVNGSLIHKLYRKIPYDDLKELLKKDEIAFIEHPDGERLKRQTIHRAARVLSEALGKKVTYSEAIMQVDDRNIEGYVLQLSKED